MKNLDVEEKLRSMDKLIPNMLPSGKQHSAKYWDEFEALIQRQADKRIYENSQTVDFMNYLIKELRVANGTYSDFVNLRGPRSWIFFERLASKYAKNG
jgi:hypothetical protein